MTLRLDITVGPVQGFVAQSRRTRDLWGSSYLLSFLAGHAMHGAKQAGGRIVQPVVDKDVLYQWISGKRDGEPPRIGSLPNRFAVDVDGDAAAVADTAQENLEAAWTRACDTVWDKFVADACEHGDGTRAIWERQVGAFWEVAWTAGPAGDGLLARRKHWRLHWPPEEPGDKCTVMHDLQELSGHVRATGSTERKAQDDFWAHVREREGIGELNLRDNERLCAVAMVKRLFPLVSEEALGWQVGQSRWPSTVHVAARPWLRRVETAAPQAAHNYAEQINRFAPTGVLSEYSPPSLDTGDSTTREFHRLDANWFHRDAVGNARLCPLKANTEDAVRDTLGKLLEAVYDTKDQNGRPLGGPASFYALLLADGDRLGKLAGERSVECVSQALADFTQKVPGVVREYDGETVYAGGDDVLAMLPVSDALRSAERLAKCYRDAFNNVPKATLSAAVVFTHIRYPLGAAIREAHCLLDDVAKEENGRDSLAVGVLKPGGLNAQWVTTWERPGPDGTCGSSVEHINALIKALVDGSRTDTSGPGLSSALLYRIRELLVGLGVWGSWCPGTWGSVPEGFHELLRAEIGHSLSVSGDKNAEERTRKTADLVQGLLRRRVSTLGDNTNAEDTAQIGVDVLLLARFLARDGQGEDES